MHGVVTQVGNTIQQLATSILTLLTPSGGTAPNTPGSSTSNGNTTITVIATNTTQDGISIGSAARNAVEGSSPGSSSSSGGGGGGTTALVVLNGSSLSTAAVPPPGGDNGSSIDSKSDAGVSLVAVIVPSVAGSLLLAGILAAFWASRLRKDILRHVSRDQQVSTYKNLIKNLTLFIYVDVACQFSPPLSHVGGLFFGKVQP